MNACALNGKGTSVQDKRTLESTRNSWLLKLGANKPLGFVVTAIAMLALVCVVNVFIIPNASMILIAGLLICTTLFGTCGGVTSAAIMTAYTLFSFSTGHDFVTFSEASLQDVIITLSGMTVVTVFVSVLRHFVATTLQQMEQLTEELEEDNQLLEAATAVDGLTGTRNRFGLRRDFTTYLGKNLFVTMLDLDNFKEINDTYGHQTGDQVLSAVGHRLGELCGFEHVYRYGGDEFLIICTHDDESELQQCANSIQSRIGRIYVEGIMDPIRFSAGYTYGPSATSNDLRLMIRQADSNLYSAKSTGKNCVIGGSFALAKQEETTQRSANTTGRIEPVLQPGFTGEHRRVMRIAI